MAQRQIDMNSKRIIGLIFMLALAGNVLAQTPPEEKPRPSVFAKKLRWGLAYDTYFSTIKGSSPAASYFTKPSLGFQVTATYFPLSFIGFEAGAGFQQRGAGITNKQKPFNSDSTYTERLRFNTIEIPLAVILRTPNDIIKGVRLSGSVGLLPMFNIRSNDVFNSYEAGLSSLDHTNNVSSSYYKNDLGYQFAFGPEIDSGGSGIFKVQFIYTAGTKNVYSNNQGTAHNQTIGFRLGVMF
jgi:Outer membrane protein beta-barrel domain